MGFFSTRKPSSSQDDIGKHDGPKRDFFSRHSYYGDRVSPRRLAKKISWMRMRPSSKEYVKQVMKKFDAPFSRGITREEFEKGLEEMKKNKRDSISDRDVERIRKFFQ